MEEIINKLLLMSKLKSDIARANFKAIKNNHQLAGVDQQCDTKILLKGQKKRLSF